MLPVQDIALGSMGPDPLEGKFIEAACVPFAWHASGSLEDADFLLSKHPELAGLSIRTAALLGDAAGVRSHLARDPAAAVNKGGIRGWDALTYLCFSRYLRLDRTRSAGFVEAATALLDAGASANTGWWETNHEPHPVWESAIYGAAGVAQHAGLTRLLLDRGADPNDDETPYHASESYDNGAVRAIVESGKLSADNLAMMLLRKADCHDGDGIVWLLAQGAEPNRMTRWGFTSLHQTLRRDNALSSIDAMLAHSGDPGIETTRDNQTGWAIAARRGRADALAAFEVRGLPPALRGVEKLTAACARDDAAQIRALLAAEPALQGNLLAEGSARLSEFAGNGNTAGVGHLLDLGVPVASSYIGDPYFGIAKNSTALHVAAWRARPGTVKYLLSRGAPADTLDAHGRTPLALAVKACVDSYWTSRRTPESVAALLQAGASVRGVLYPCGYAEVDDLLRQAGAR